MAVDPPEALLHERCNLKPKYMTLEYGFILMSLYLTFNGFEFLILLILFYLHKNKYLIYYLQTSRKAY